MKLITILLCAAAAAFPQATESRMPVTDAEKVADALRAGPVFVRMRRCSTGRQRLEANIAFFVTDRSMDRRE